MQSAHAPRSRLPWVDAAKAYGIFLVFYGHLVESVRNPAALTQQKLVYAFHVPLFILLSGYLAHSAADLPPLWPFLKRQAATRVLPVVFFCVLMMPFFPLHDALRDHLPVRPVHVRTDWIDRAMCSSLSPPDAATQSPARRKLWEALPAAAQAAVWRAAGGEAMSTEAREDIAAAMDRALSRSDLFAAEDFAAAGLSGRDRAWLASDRASQPTARVRDRNVHLMWQALFPRQGHGGAEDGWLQRAQMTLRGYTDFNTPVWFLVCLFVVELIHFGVVRLLPRPGRVLAAIPVFYAVGWLVTRNVPLFSDVWFARESVFLYAFYLMGYWLRRAHALERGGTWWSGVPLFVVGSVVLWLTFDHNPGSRVFAPVVLINLSQHGDLLWFTLAAVAGCLAVVGLARVTPAWRPVSFTGRHTLVLMGLNGLFFEIVNRYLVAVLDLPDAPSAVFFGCTVVTLACLAVCAPMVWALERYVPQLVGRPRSRGPLLPRLVA